MCTISQRTSDHFFHSIDPQPVPGPDAVRCCPNREGRPQVSMSDRLTGQVEEVLL